MTLYASREDKALKLSSQINSEKRAGLAPPAPEIINATTKLVFIDTSDIKRTFLDFIDHADFTAGAFNDVRGVIWTEEGTENRCALQKAFVLSVAYWKAQTNSADVKCRCMETPLKISVKRK